MTAVRVLVVCEHMLTRISHTPNAYAALSFRSGGSFQDRRAVGPARRAYREVLVACPEKTLRVESVRSCHCQCFATFSDSECEKYGLIVINIRKRVVSEAGNGRDGYCNRHADQPVRTGWLGHSPSRCLSIIGCVTGYPADDPATNARHPWRSMATGWLPSSGVWPRHRDRQRSRSPTSWRTSPVPQRA